MKVVMPSEEDKVKVLKSLRNLKTAPEPYRSVRVSCDMTKTERENHKKLLEEAKNRDRNDPSGDWIHLVRGLPDQRRIIRVKRRQT